MSDEASRSPGQVSPESYDTWRRTRLGSITEARELELIFRLTGPLQGRRLLDAGCGDGLYLVEAASRGAQVSGVDISEAMLSVARRRAADAGVNVELYRGDIEALPFEDNTFDIVTAITVLCFVPDPQQAIDEMERVLTTGGRLVIGELGRWNTWRRGGDCAAGWGRRTGSRQPSNPADNSSTSSKMPGSMSKACVEPSTIHLRVLPPGCSHGSSIEWDGSRHWEPRSSPSQRSNLTSPRRHRPVPDRTVAKSGGGMTAAGVIHRWASRHYVFALSS